MVDEGQFKVGDKIRVLEFADNTNAYYEGTINRVGWIKRKFNSFGQKVAVPSDGTTEDESKAYSILVSRDTVGAGTKLGSTLHIYQSLPTSDFENRITLMS